MHVPSRSVAFSLMAALLVTLSAITAWHFQLPERAWFEFQQWHYADQRRERSLWLPDYRAVVQAQVIEGVEDDLSALTYDPDRNSLIAVTNGDPRLLELSLDGRLLRSVRLEGFGDPEAIEYVSRGVYVISDEREQRLLQVEVDEHTSVIDASGARQLSLGIGRNGNKGFEGLAYDAPGRRLFVAKERDPLRIYEIQGFPHSDPNEPYAVHVQDDPRRDADLFVRDLSSLQYDEASGHLLALSDESRLVVELDLVGRPLSSLRLTAGQHGLEADVPQAEGIAMSADGTLYLVSEPNLFYVFRK